MLAKDSIYARFSKLYDELIAVEKIRSPRIQQLIEDFGLWLKMNQDEDTIDSFIEQARDKYHNSIFTNPSYVIDGHCGDGHDINILKKAIEIDDIYNLAAHYYTAKCLLSLGKKNDEDYKSNAIAELIETANRTSELIAYLTAMSISLAHDIDDNEPLKQTTVKISFLKTFSASIQKAIDTISKCAPDMEVRPGGMICKGLITPELTDKDEKEIEFLGIDEIFDVEIYKPEPKGKFWSTVFVGCCAMLQIFAGIAITVCSAGTAIKLGASIFVEGLMDAYRVAKAHSKGENIDLDEYFTSKAISYAIIGAQVKVNNMNAVNEAAKEGAKEGVKQAVEATIKNPMQLLIKESAIKIAQTVAVQKIVEFASDEIRDNVLDGLEERMAHAIAKIIDTSLEANSVLLTKNYNVERHQIIEDIKKIIVKAVKSHKNVRIINDLASGLLKATSAAQGTVGAVATGIYAIHKVGRTIDAASKIEPIIDDLKIQIADVINSAGVRAKARPKVASIEQDIKYQEKVKEEMSAAISSMVASTLMNQIQRNVTNPMVSEVVTEFVSKTVHEYRTKQAEELKKYQKALYQTQMQEKLGLAAGDAMGRQSESLEAKEAYESKNSINKDKQYEQAKKQENIKVSLAESNIVMQKIAQKTGQTIYLFKNKKLENTYGKGEKGLPISIEYDSLSGKYFSLNHVEKSSHVNIGINSIYAAMASQTGGKYSSDDLFQIFTDVQDSLVPMHTSRVLQGDRQYTTASTYELSISQNQELIDLAARVNYFSTLAAAKKSQQLQPVELSQETIRYLSNIFKINNSQTSTVDSSSVYSTTNNQLRFSLVSTAQTYPGASVTTTVSNNTQSTLGYIFSELFGIQSAQANPVAIAIGVEKVVVGTGVLLGAMVSNKAVKDYNEYQASTNYSRDYTLNAQEGSYLPALTGNPMLSGMNAGLFANPVDQMRFDGIIPEVDTPTTRNNIVENHGRTMPIMQTETSALLRNIDANLDKPTITDFSTHHQPRSILFTPDSRDSLAELSRLPGFSPSMLDTWQESFPDDRNRLAEFSNLPGFTPIHTSIPTVETFPVHEEDINDWILLRDKTNEEIYQELGGKATSEILGELPNVQGSYGDNVGLRLKEACDQLYNAPKHESRVIAGVGSNVPIKDIERITKTYGGTEEDWTKLSSKKIEYKEGILVPTRIIKIEIHWYENIKTGEKVEAKPKIKNNEWKRK